MSIGKFWRQTPWTGLDTEAQQQAEPSVLSYLSTMCSWPKQTSILWSLQNMILQLDYVQTLISSVAKTPSQQTRFLNDLCLELFAVLR